MADRRHWSRHELALLSRLYPDTPTERIALKLGRPIKHVYAAANHRGLKKSDAFMATDASGRLFRGGVRGLATRFKPGQAPANKGIRRPGWHRGRMRETQFKKGQRRPDTRAIGDTRLVDGYLYVKVAEVPNVAYTVNWYPMHMLMWEMANGPVPKGHALIFKNGDRADIRLDNLELLSRADLMRRNTYHRYGKEIAQVIQLRGAINRQINRRTRRENENR